MTNLKSMNWVFGLLILMPLSYNTLLQVSKYSVMSVSSSPHCTMSSANIIDPGTSFLTSSVNTSTRSRNRYGLKAEPWCSPTSTPKLLLSPAALRTTGLHPRYMSWTILMYFSGTFRSLEHLHISSLGMRSYAFSRSINVTLIFFCPSLCFSIVCFSMKIASVVLLPGMNPNWLSCIFVQCLILLSTTLSHILKVCDRSLVTTVDFALLDVTFSLEDWYQYTLSPSRWHLFRIHNAVEQFT